MDFLKCFLLLFLEPGTSGHKAIEWGPLIQLNSEENTLLAQQLETTLHGLKDLMMC